MESFLGATCACVKLIISVAIIECERRGSRFYGSVVRVLKLAAGDGGMSVYMYFISLTNYEEHK